MIRSLLFVTLLSDSLSTVVKTTESTDAVSVTTEAVVATEQNTDLQQAASGEYELSFWYI